MYVRFLLCTSRSIRFARLVNASWSSMGRAVFHKRKIKYIFFTSTVFSTEIGKSPYVAQSDCITHTRQEKIKSPSPCFSLGQFIRLLLGHDFQWPGHVFISGHLVQFCDLSVRFGAVRRHVSGFGRGSGSRTGGFSTGPRRQQLRGF